MSENRIVLDASAILALLNKEPGSEKLSPELLANAVCSSVNLAEVQTKLVLRGLSPNDAWEYATSPIREVIDFTSVDAKIAGDMVPHTRHLGLSLGDRACLTVGLSMNAPIYTTDRSWKSLKLNLRIHVIR